jgi:NAD(P)-dependent dehydrogenase (short-subunit alcohol dehydrogenase family)
MLFAISLAKKLGSRGLQAFSLHPGAILDTSLAKHLDTLDSLGSHLKYDSQRLPS